MVTNMHFQTIEQKNNINIYTYIYLYNVISNRRPTVTEKRCREGGGETERDSVYMGDPAFFFFSSFKWNDRVSFQYSNPFMKLPIAQRKRQAKQEKSSLFSIYLH